MPDLTFTEMRFLQKPRDEDGYVPAEARRVPRRHERKGYSTSKDQEMAAFFRSPNVSAANHKPSNRRQKHPTAGSLASEQTTWAKKQFPLLEQCSSTQKVSTKPRPAADVEETCKSGTPYTWSETQHQPHSSSKRFGLLHTSIRVGTLKTNVQDELLDDVRPLSHVRCQKELASLRQIAPGRENSLLQQSPVRVRMSRGEPQLDHSEPARKSKSSSPLEKILQACDAALDVGNSAFDKHQTRDYCAAEAVSSGNPNGQTLKPVPLNAHGLQHHLQGRPFPRAVSQHESLYENCTMRHVFSTEDTTRHASGLNEVCVDQSANPRPYRQKGLQDPEEFFDDHWCDNPAYLRNAAPLSYIKHNGEQYEGLGSTRHGMDFILTRSHAGLPDEGRGDREYEEFEDERMLHTDCCLSGDLDQAQWAIEPSDDRPVVQLIEPTEILPAGFWRPNKLY